jgi:thiamine biosynthesis lipoprotein
MQEYRFRAMGCQMLAAVDSDDAPAVAQLAKVPRWFEAWEQQLSRFRAGSDLSCLNQAAGRPVVVPPALWEVLGVALDAARRSEGLVQPTILAALEAAGYDRSFDQLAPAIAGTPPPAHAADWRALKLDRRTRTVTLPAGVRLDLGGEAKGWAADQAARRLAEAGPALVDAGGDIGVSGPMADGSPWPIAITNPFAPEASLGLVLLARGAVATSGRDYRRWTRGGVELHHIIDPRSGQPAQTDILSATIVAPDGPMAEMTAKMTLILGSQAGLAWLEARPTVAGLLVLEDGRILRSRRMDIYLDMISLPVRVASAQESARPMEIIQ